MNNTDLEILAKHLAKNFFPKQIAPITAKKVLTEINDRLDQINSKMGTGFKTPIGEPQFREMINYIRANQLIKEGELIAGSKGYYITTDLDEILKYIDGLEGRIRSMYSAIGGMRKRTGNYKRKAPDLMTIKKMKIDGDLFDSL